MARTKRTNKAARSSQPVATEASAKNADPTTRRPVSSDPAQNPRGSAIENPWVSLVFLPILTTLLGVLAALYVDNWRASQDQMGRAVGLLQIAREECGAIVGALDKVVIDQQPVFVPSLGIALINIQQDSASLNVVPAEDFREFVRQLVGIQAALSDYGRLANDFRFLAIQQPRGFPPPILPFPKGPPQPQTPEQAEKQYMEMMDEMNSMKESALAQMRTTLQSYKDAVTAFCAVAENIRTKLVR